jgi:uncharacterized Fe-S radical SAM superfamily protein PflX
MHVILSLKELIFKRKLQMENMFNPKRELVSALSGQSTLFFTIFNYLSIYSKSFAATNLPDEKMRKKIKLGKVQAQKKQSKNVNIVCLI